MSLLPEEVVSSGWDDLQRARSIRVTRGEHQRAAVSERRLFEGEKVVRGNAADEEDRFARIGDDRRRTTETTSPCSSSPRAPGNSYRRISTVNPPAPRGEEETTDPISLLGSVDFTFYSLLARLALSFHLSHPLHLSLRWPCTFY